MIHNVCIVFVVHLFKAKSVTIFRPHWFKWCIQNFHDKIVYNYFMAKLPWIFRRKFWRLYSNRFSYKSGIILCVRCLSDKSELNGITLKQFNFKSPAIRLSNFQTWNVDFHFVVKWPYIQCKLMLFNWMMHTVGEGWRVGRVSNCMLSPR